MKRLSMGLIGVSIWCVAGSAALADCGPRLAELRRLATAGDFEGAARTVKDIGANGWACDKVDNRAAKRILASAYLKEADRLRGDPVRRADLLRQAAGQQESWKAALAFGRFQLEAMDYIGAAESLQTALNKVDENRTAISRHEPETEPDASAAELRDLTRLAEEATHLAATAPGGRLIHPPMTRLGTIGGVFNPAVNRDAQAFREPVPILFAFRSDELTEDGRKAADILVGAMIQLEPSAIVVTGHTDKVGSDEFNMALSLRRAQRVADHLRTHGVKASIEVVGKGKREPRKLSAGTSYTEQQIDDLNRRVEFSW